MSLLVHEWESFFVAEAGAAAALSGLVFVSVSISLQHILGSSYLRDRAVETLLTFLTVLEVASCGLVPNQGSVPLGAEIGGFGVLLWLVSTRRNLRAYLDPNLEAEARRWLWVRFLGAQASSLPFIVAGLSLVTGHENGLLWIAPGTLASLVAGAFNAWVLLVEIQR